MLPKIMTKKRKFTQNFFFFFFKAVTKMDSSFKLHYHDQNDSPLWGSVEKAAAFNVWSIMGPQSHNFLTCL